MTLHEKEILKKKFGTTIQGLRKSKRLTLRQVAAACQLDNSKIAKIEDGRTGDDPSNAGSPWCSNT